MILSATSHAPTLAPALRPVQFNQAVGKASGGATASPAFAGFHFDFGDFKSEWEEFWDHPADYIVEHHQSADAFFGVASLALSIGVGLATVGTGGAVWAPVLAVAACEIIRQAAIELAYRSDSKAETERDNAERWLSFGTSSLNLLGAAAPLVKVAEMPTLFTLMGGNAALSWFGAQEREADAFAASASAGLSTATTFFMYVLAKRAFL